MNLNRTSLGVSRSIGLLILLLLGAPSLAQGVRFAGSLTDHAVLQRDKPITIRGFAEKGAAITVSFAGQTKQATTDQDGQWSVTLDAMPAAANGRDLTATSGQAKAKLSDVVVGDVILFARQTAVDVSLGRDKSGQAIAAAIKANAGFRVMRVKTIPATTPQPDLAPQATDGWSVVDQKSAKAMAAAAFYFGRDLAAQVDVPIGIIDLNMGSNFTIGWVDRQALAGNDEYYGRKTRSQGYADWMDESLEKFKAQEGQTPPANTKGWVREDPIKDPMFPAAGYNATLHPLRHLRLKAIIYQFGNDYPYMAYERLRHEGRSFDRDALNVAWWENYLHRKRGYRAGIELIPRVPSLWRTYFGDRQLPMGLIMPPGSDHPSYAIHNRETRELQRQTAAANAKVGLILPGEKHIPFSGQPADDALLAKRTFAWTMASVYERENVVPSGPLFSRMDVNYSKAQLFFKPGTAQGLTAKPGALDHFEVAGLDKQFAPAKASIDGNTIRLTSDVSRIAFVRYNYQSKPDQGLTNAAGLPAIPFRTGDHKFVDVPRGGEQNLPPEYTTPAGEWKAGDIAIVSGGGAAYRNGPGWLGATGLLVRPFGPNMRVIKVLPESPADGEIKVGDMIYKVNDQLLGDDHLRQVGQAITLAESEAGGGKISFAFRRGNELLDTTLTVEVLGTYSATSPYDCPKADRIIANSEAYLAKRGGLASDAAGGGWLHSDIMFLLGAGTPEYQGLVRRFIYQKIAEIDGRGKGRAPSGWTGGHGAMLFAEYYLATGDRNVLPYLKKYCDRIAETQCREGTFETMGPRSTGGWRHNYPGGQGYGMIPTIGLPAMIGMTLSKEAGVELDEAAYKRGMRMFYDRQAEMGYNDYAAVMPIHTAPENIDPQKQAAGMLSSYNGSRGLAAVLFNLDGNTRVAHLNSMYCVYAYNNCHGGHGSNFFNGMWTPIGANIQGKAAFVHFMQHHYWFRDLKRMFNHASIPSRRGAAGVGHDLALVVPRQRLRVIGAPPSVFAANPPARLKPALDAYHARDYAKADKLVTGLLTGGEMPSDDRTMATQLQRASREIQQSIEADLTNAEALLKQGKPYEAGLDLRQLKGVAPADHARLIALDKAIADVDARTLRDDKSRYDALQKSLSFSTKGAGTAPDADINWQSLTTVTLLDRRQRNTPGLVSDDQATPWRVKIIEAINQAPDGWPKPEFDDGQWGQTTLPISWHLNHTLLGRASFDVADVADIEALRVSCRPFRQLNIVVYINGHIVAKFNQCENNSRWVHGVLPPAALKHLKPGRNTIAFSTTHDWRWSSRGNVSGGGFGLKLDKATKVKP
jgi:sialate O-acetylesterase